MDQSEIDKLIKAGEIAKQVKDFARSITKKGVSLLEIANKIDEKIIELGGKPAFPVNLSINEVAAHSTPQPNDETKAFGLLKIDVGVQIEGYVADTAFSLDLENSKENKKLIEATEDAQTKSVEIFSFGIKLRAIGSVIEKTITSYGFEPVRNLSGHSIAHFDLHSGLTIPNHDNNSEQRIEDGVYAVEPFATNGVGKVRDGKLSGIFHLEKAGNVRDPFAREVLNYIKEEFQTLPFCIRWLHNKFGSRALIAMKRIEEADLVHHYPQLIESSRGKVAQAEHTIIIDGSKKIVTT
jgi:methionyl aminopeptidase